MNIEVISLEEALEKYPLLATFLADKNNCLFCEGMATKVSVYEVYSIRHCDGRECREAAEGHIIQCKNYANKIAMKRVKMSQPEKLSFTKGKIFDIYPFPVLPKKGYDYEIATITVNGATNTTATMIKFVNGWLLIPLIGGEFTKVNDRLDLPVGGNGFLEASDRDYQMKIIGNH